MRVLYISIGHVTEGVRKKLVDKTATLRESGIDVHICWVSNQKIQQDPYSIQLSVDFRAAERIGKWPLLWRLSVAEEQRKIYKTISGFLRREHFDFILCRYPVADYFLWRFMKAFPGRVIFEHNSIEARELEIRKVNSFYYNYFSWGEWLFGRSVRRMAKALVSVTPEISAWQIKTAGVFIPHTVISNGLNVSRVPCRENNRFNGRDLNLLLLAGSEAPWHGVEKVLRGLAAYQGECTIHCYLAGNINEELKEQCRGSSRVTVLPHQTGVELDRLVNSCHIGIGSVGFDKSFLTQACTLKVREYWARGLPFVLGYDDADLIGNEEMGPYYLKVMDAFDLEPIISFANRAYAIPEVSQGMRALAFKRIDYLVKAKLYADFINATCR